MRGGGREGGRDVLPRQLRVKKRVKRSYSEEGREGRRGLIHTQKLPGR